MSFVCELCDYITDNKYYFLKHNKSKKHFDKIINLEIDKEEFDKEEIDNKKNEETTDKYVCKYCDIKIIHQSSYSRHTKKCKEKYKDNIEKDTDKKKIKMII
jgi:hypothetical protein